MKIESKLTTLGLSIVLIFCFASITDAATATALPKGNCVNPQPYTNLRHCRFEGADLRNKNLEGSDLRGMLLYKTQLQGANLTKALFDGGAITQAYVDGVIGLPNEVIAILKSAYLVTKNDKDLVLATLPSDYVGSNTNIAGLNNVFLVKKVADSQNTIALLSYPRNGDSFSEIFARFDNNKFNFPTCYRSIDLMDDGHTYYWPHLDSLQVKPLKNGGYLIGAVLIGSDGDDEGLSEWKKISLLEFSPTCQLTVLHEEFLERAGQSVKRNGEFVDEWCGGEMDYRFVDDQTVEIKTTIPASTKQVCEKDAHAHKKILSKKIKLNLHQ
jgi:Pentapeptide repeats (8 copies)